MRGHWDHFYDALVVDTMAKEEAIAFGCSLATPNTTPRRVLFGDAPTRRTYTGSFDPVASQDVHTQLFPAATTELLSCTSEAATNTIRIHTNRTSTEALHNHTERVRLELLFHYERANYVGDTRAVWAKSKCIFLGKGIIIQDLGGLSIIQAISIATIKIVCAFLSNATCVQVTVSFFRGWNMADTS